MKFSLFKYHSGVLYGTALALTSVSPDTGPSTGGQDFVLWGTAFDYTLRDDTFEGLVLDPTKWTDISTGLGSVTVGAAHLFLETDATPGAFAGVESFGTFTDAQYEARINIPAMVGRPDAQVMLFCFSLYANANNHADIIITKEVDGSIEMTLSTTVSGNVADSVTIDWTIGLSTLKILRWGSSVYFYANGALQFATKSFVVTAAYYRMFAYNNAANYNVYGVIVESFLCKPFAAFDTEVVHDLTIVGSSRARGITPASLDKSDQSAGYAGLVDVSIVAGSTVTMTDAYEYYYVDSLTLVQDSQFSVKISAIDDNSVKTPETATRGLGGGK